MQIKAVRINLSIGWVKENFGDAGFSKILNAVSEEDQRILSSKFIPVTTWVSFDTYMHLLAAIVSELGSGDESILMRLSADCTKKELRGVYSIFIKLGSPEFIIKRAASMFEKYFSFGEVAVTNLGHKNIMLRFCGFEKQHRLIEVATFSFCKVALELTGGKNPDVKLVKSLADGTGYFELACTWS
ncbi:MAG: hypothetical protein GY858_09605 [Candidatus Omnitrophica bacterium]|nr:hypothetical protein [Candidatus Omnitrophota bacterium]